MGRTGTNLKFYRGGSLCIEMRVWEAGGPGGQARYSEGERLRKLYTRWQCSRYYGGGEKGFIAEEGFNTTRNPSLVPSEGELFTK